MSEQPNEIYGEGVTVSGRDITWFRVSDARYPFGDEAGYALTEPFEDEA